MSASAATSTKAKACDLFTAAQVKALAEGTLSKLPAATTVGITFCQWSAPGSLQTTISNMPANEWLKQFPELMNELDKDGTLAKFPETKQKMNEALAKIRARQALPPGEACRVFADVLQLRGYPAGQQQAVFIYPNSTNPQGLTGQSCLDSTFIAVSLFAPGGPARNG